VNFTIGKEFVKAMKQKLAIIAWILLILFSFAPFASAQWQQVGPPNVVVSGLGSFGNYVFAGTDKGLFRSSDAGKNWEAINNGLTDSADIGTFTTICTELFAGTQFHIFRSSNWGASWIEADSGYTASPLHDLATSGTIIYACGQNAFGVWRSEDSGKTWIRGGLGITGLNRIYSLTTIGTTVFVTSVSGVYQSADSARSWSTSIISDTSYSVIRANNNVLYTRTGGDVLLSKNLGQSWTLFNSGLLKITVDAFAFNGSVIFVCGSGGVFRVKDNSGVWTSINQGLPINYTFNSLAINGGYIFIGAGPQRFGSSSIGNGI
jgi:photosystem II stability/assembly factor-like uncharacterized protein